MYYIISSVCTGVNSSFFMSIGSIFLCYIYSRGLILRSSSVTPYPTDTLELFHPLSCGGFQRILQSMIMWLSSGGTTSVLHNDEFENINCVLDGSKQFIFIDEVALFILSIQHLYSTLFTKERALMCLLTNSNEKETLI